MNSPHAASGGPPARHSTLRFVLILGALTAFGPLSIDMYLPAFPAIERGLGATMGEVQWTLAVFFIGLAVGQAVYGPIADRYGRRAPLLAGLALYVLASVIAALAPDIATLTAMRLAQALGGCAGIVIARAMVIDLFDERQSARMFSHLMLVMGLAPILAPLAGGQILLLFDWPAIFWVLAAFGAACLVAAQYGLPETLPPERRSTGGVFGAFAGYLTLAGDRAFIGISGGSALTLGGMFAYITGSPFVFIDLFGVSPQIYGLLFGMNALGLIAASQLNTLLLRRFPARRILSAATLVYMLAGLALAAVAATGVDGLATLLAPLFVAIASIGLIAPNAVATAMGRARAQAGAGAALIGILQFGLGAVTSAVVGLLHDGTALPMCGMIAALGIAGFAANRFGTAALRAAR